MTPEGVEAYPLSWPAAWPRTGAGRRERARFKVAFVVARNRLMNELKLMGASHVVLSTNIPTRRDGLPYADMANPKDPGVAIYFSLKSKPMVFACDRWDRIQDNIHAVELTIGALRGLERWGASDLLERAFAGFTALPAPASTKRDFRIVLGLRDGATLADAKAARNDLLRRFHPDLGVSPSHEKTSEINDAWAEAERVLK